MSTTSIQNFDFVTAGVLKALYGNFPEAIKLDPYTAGLSDENATWSQAGTSTNTQEWKDLQIQVILTAKWLAEEGYIRERAAGHGSKYIITEVGLRTLGILFPETKLPKILTIE